MENEQDPLKHFAVVQTLPPGWRDRRSTFGSSVSITAHSSSPTSHGFGRATLEPPA